VNGLAKFEGTAMSASQALIPICAWLRRFPKVARTCDP
jgi:hypothetical protein